MFDNDCEGRAMTEFVCLRAKMYDYQINKEVTKKILENFHYLVYKYNYSCIDLIKSVFPIHVIMFYGDVIALRFNLRS